MIFTTDYYNFEFSDEGEADDGNVGSTRFFRLYCLDKEGNEIASICTNLSVNINQDDLREFISNLTIYLNRNSDLSTFRAIERYIFNFDKSEKQNSRLSDAQV